LSDAQLELAPLGIKFSQRKRSGRIAQNGVRK